MKIRDKICIVYDVEVFRNIFHVCAFNTETNTMYKFEISPRTSNIDSICTYFNNTIDRILVGYNNLHYDNIIIAYLIELYDKGVHNSQEVCNRLYNLSQHLVNTKIYDQVKKWKYKFWNNSLDLMTMLFSNKLRVGLKALQVTMNYHNVLEFKHDFSQDLDPQRFDEMIDYNINDVESTTKLLNQCKNQIDLRVKVEDKYGVEVLNKDDVSLGMAVLEAEYRKRTNKHHNDIAFARSKHLYTLQNEDWNNPIEINLKDVILPFIKYDTPVLQKMLSDLKQLTVSPGRKGLEYDFIFDGLKYNIGVGGIHSKNNPEMVVPTEDQILADYDVASLYPSLLIEYDFYPKYLGPEFKEGYSNMKTERLEFKRLKMKDEDTMFKFALNGLSGNLQQEHSFVYDPFAVMQIRMNGQLLLMMLAEKYVQNGIRIIQANTDGLFVLYDKSLQPKVDEINKEWEELTKLKLEGEFFKGFYQLAVNDYFSISQNGSLKKKGIFSDVSLGKGLRPKIITDAVIAFFKDGTSIMNTITNCTDIKKFLMSEKTGSQWEVIYNNEKQQRINRFYASTNGAYLYKKKKNSDGTEQWNNMLSSSGVTILNKFDDKSIEERNINYKYYIDEAYKLMLAIKPRQLSLW